jgi:hypothetical protein
VIFIPVTIVTVCRIVEQLRGPFEKFVDSCYYSVFEKWVERCKKGGT